MFKQRLLQALSTAVDAYNTGMSDNDAVIKAASDFSFNNHQATRLAEAYNHAKTINHLKVADDRASTFPLADPAAIVATMFTPAKTAAARKTASARAGGLDFYNEKPEAFQVKVAASSFDDGLCTKTASTAATWNEIVELRTAARDFQSTANEISYHYGACVRKIAASLQFVHVDPAEVIHGILVKHGAAGTKLITDILLNAPHVEIDERKIASLSSLSTAEIDYPVIFDDVTEAITCKDEHAKHAGAGIGLGNAASELERELLGLNGRVDAAPLVMTEDEEGKLAAEALADRMLNDAAASQTTARIVAEATGDLKQAAAPGTPTKVDPSATNMRASPVQSYANDIKDVASGVGSNIDLMTETGKGLSTNLISVMDNTAQNRSKALSQHTNLQGEIAKIRRQVMLSDLMANDPIIAGADPQAIASAYQQLLSVAPHLANNRASVAAILRQTIHTDGTMSPFDAKSLSDADLAQQRAINPSLGRAEAPQ